MCAYAAAVPVRYVRTDGSYTNDGKSWATAKDKVQDAINDLNDELRQNHLDSGVIYIAAGTYAPTESTELTGGSLLNTSFKIYGGIHLFGGFNPDSLESKPGDRIMSNDKKVSENWADQEGIGTVSGSDIASQWDLKYKTILTGNHAGSPPTFVFDSVRGRYNTVFPASSYHVVWFATNGIYDVGKADSTTAGHYRPLDKPASIDGCVISSGNASTKNTTVREHTAYGGGVYMVANSSLRACTIENCYATMRGGGIYMDGGGVAEFCYVHTCQAAGVGVYEGYGGGVCIDYDGVLGHSHVTNCAARCGGGLTITHLREEYPEGHRGVTISHYSPYTSASVINNNTAAAEGGGIYLAAGGTVNHATVTGNYCIGPDVTYYGRRHGRSGGIYVRDCGLIFNSVFWGNRCDANNDIQFASVRQNTLSMVIDPGHADDDAQQVFVYHSAFMNHDITDWTGATKEMVFTLEKNNLPKQGAKGNYPCFFNPTVNPNNWPEHNHATGIFGAGVFRHMDQVEIPGPRIWHLTSYSALDQKGVQVSEAVQNVSFWLKHAHTPYGVVSNPYEPSSTLGGLVRKADPIVHSMVKQQGQEGRLPGGETLIPTLFVDPNRKGVFDGSGNFDPQDIEGNSWTTPIRDLGEALQYFRLVFHDENPAHRFYRLPNLDGDGKPIAGDSTDYSHVQVLIKPGTLTTVGPGNYVNKNLRTAAIVTYGHMRLYGGYPDTLTATNTAGRNPRTYRSIIDCNVTGVEGAAGYANNSAHAIALVNADSAVVDGFMLQSANGINVHGGLASSDGGGLVLNNSTILQARRVDMVGNQLRNCVISNCISEKGSGVFVNAEFPKANGQTCYAELKMVNTIVRNTTVKTTPSGAKGAIAENHGVIAANGRAFIHLDHCDVANNVGYPFHPGHKSIVDGSELLYEGIIRVDNSLIYCNGDEVLNDRSLLDEDGHDVTSVDPDHQGRVFGTYNMFDADIKLHEDNPTEPTGFFADGYSLDGTGFASANASFFNVTVPADSMGRHNECLFTRTDVTADGYPTFVNPSRNVGHSESGDKPMYGGIVAYSPMNTNPVVNAANKEGHTDGIDNFDRSDVIKRSHGGAPDIGAIEDTDLPAAGEVIYVTPDGAGKRDGSSWDNAIAGNTVYRLSGVVGPDLATGDSVDVASNARLINKSTGDPVLTSDNRYCGGFARSYMTSSKTGATSTTTVTNAWTTEVNVYTNGARAGERDTIQNKVHSETSNTTPGSGGSSEPGFEPGYYNDTRYPYGELSGASRSFWRANPYHAGNTWMGDYVYNASKVKDFIDSCNAKGWINNTRAERYVSGLQYAVEKASAANKSVHKDSVQVWIGAGKYTDYKGYVMRDSVKVYGGFPYGKYSSPGIAERHALLSNVINIPKALDAQDYTSSDYETILQISDSVPVKDSAFYTGAVKFYDNDWTRSQATDSRSYLYKTKQITNTYTFTTNETDNTSKYINYPTMKEAGMDQGGTAGDITFGSETSTKDCWHISYPTEQPYYHVTIEVPSADLYIYNYEDSTYLEKKNSKWIRMQNGSLTGLCMWQTMKNLEDGTHKLTLDMMGGYRNGNDFDVKTHSNIFLHILDSAGIDLVDSVELKCSDHTDLMNKYVKNNVRVTAYRKTIEFTTTDTMNVTIMVKVLDGTRNTGVSYPKTASGGDPNPIPWNYKYDKGTEASPSQDWGTNNPNRREFNITNLKLMTVDKNNTYVLTSTDTIVNDTVVDSPKASEVISTETYAVSGSSRTTLRKRVLTMPDVCVPTYGAGGIGNPTEWGKAFNKDVLPHTDRVIGATKELRTATTNTKYEDPHYVEYKDVY